MSLTAWVNKVKIPYKNILLPPKTFAVSVDNIHIWDLSTIWFCVHIISWNELLRLKLCRAIFKCGYWRVPGTFLPSRFCVFTLSWKSHQGWLFSHHCAGCSIAVFQPLFVFFSPPDTCFLFCFCLGFYPNRFNSSQTCPHLNIKLERSGGGGWREEPLFAIVSPPPCPDDCKSSHYIFF